jgi:hypothetical protein
MRPRLPFRCLGQRRWIAIVVALCVPAGLWAQNPDNTARGATQVTNASAALKPVRKPDQVITNDTIALLAVRRAPGMMTAAVAEPGPAKGEGAGADAVTQKAADIASLEQRAKDQQKRIALLMKLFVSDEKEFLKNAGGAEADPAVQERRRYEQDELRWETAELAKLTAKLEEQKNENRK